MPITKPFTIYLDLNHWYTLAEARAGHPRRASHVSVLQQLLELVERGLAVTPLSAVHYMEITENPRDAQRREVGNVMAEISRFCTLASATRFLQEELDTALKARFGRPVEIRSTPRIGTGVGFAFGKPSRLQLTGDPEALAQLRNQPKGAEWVATVEQEANAYAERVFISGPPNAARPTIPGYDPYAARRTADSELERVKHVVEGLRADKRLYRRLDDVLFAQEIVVDLMDVLNDAMSYARIRQDEWPAERKTLTDFLLSLPSRRVSVAIKRRYLQDLTRKWTVSDVRDISAMSFAVPYCAVVVTDMAVCDALTRAGLDKAFDTVVLNDLDALAAYLATRSSSTGDAI
jgi:hypothetical protein